MILEGKHVKNILLKTGFIFAAALLGAGSLNSHANADEFRRSIDIKVPHAFVVGHETLPGGRYTISSADTNGGEFEIGNPRYLLIRGNGQSALIGVSHRIYNPDISRTQLVMHENPEDATLPYTMDKFFMAGVPSGYQFAR